MMRSDFQLWGVDRVDPGTVTIVGQIVCTDGGRWPVQREFNRRMAHALRELGMRVTSPVQTVRRDFRPARDAAGPATKAPPAGCAARTAGAEARDRCCGADLAR